MQPFCIGEACQFCAPSSQGSSVQGKKYFASFSHDGILELFSFQKVKGEASLPRDSFAFIQKTSFWRHVIGLHFHFGLWHSVHS